MRFLRLLIAALCLAMLGLVTAPAHAIGTLSISTPIWENRDQTDRKLDVINRRDCLDEDALITFQVTFGNAPGGAFEVWSGTGCEAYTARSGTSPTCVKVFAGNSNVNQKVSVRVQSIVRAASDDFNNAAAGTATACDASNSTSQSSRSLFFVVYDTGNNMSLITMTPKWAFKYDTVGPSPPTGISADSGESSLNPRFTPPSGETNIIKYHFYCSPALQTTNTGGTSSGGTSSGGTDTGGTAGTDAMTSGTGGIAGSDMIAAGGGGADSGGAATGGTDTGGTAGTGGTDTGGTAGTSTTETGSSGADTGAGGDSTGTAGSDDATCGSDTLHPGEDPPADLVECGSVTSTGASKGQTNDTLENGVRYAVAVAAEDDANNIGKLSKLACGVPQEVTGFYEAYRAAGGEAGGGFCSFSPARRGSAAMGLLMILGTCALLARRRR